MESAYQEPIAATAWWSQPSYRLFRVPVRPMTPWSLRVSLANLG